MFIEIMKDVMPLINFSSDLAQTHLQAHQRGNKAV